MRVVALIGAGPSGADLVWPLAVLREKRAAWGFDPRFFRPSNCDLFASLTALWLYHLGECRE